MFSLLISYPGSTGAFSTTTYVPSRRVHRQSRVPIVDRFFIHRARVVSSPRVVRARVRRRPRRARERFSPSRRSRRARAARRRSRPRRARDRCRATRSRRRARRASRTFSFFAAIVARRVASTADLSRRRGRPTAVRGAMASVLGRAVLFAHTIECDALKERLGQRRDGGAEDFGVAARDDLALEFAGL